MKLRCHVFYIILSEQQLLNAPVQLLEKKNFRKIGQHMVFTLKYCVFFVCNLGTDLSYDPLIKILFYFILFSKKGQGFFFNTLGGMEAELDLLHYSSPKKKKKKICCIKI